MTATWTQGDRERAYTALCEAVTAAGRSGEAEFLARLALLLMEHLGDPAAFSRCLAEAAVATPPIRALETIADAPTTLVDEQMR